MHYRVILTKITTELHDFLHDGLRPMPKREHMSWNKSQRRWEKMKDGKRYWVTAAALGYDPDEHDVRNASYQAANQWWEDQLARILADKVKNRPHNAILEKLETRLDWLSRSFCDTSYGKEISETIEAIKSMPEDDYKTAVSLSRGSELGERIWQDRLSRDERNKLPRNKTIGYLASEYITELLDNAEKGVGSISSATTAKKAVTNFVKFIGSEQSIDVIDDRVFKSWYVFCESQLAKNDNGSGGWALNTVKVYYSNTKSFLLTLAERDLYTLPKNFNNKKYSFGRPESDIKCYTQEEVKKLFAVVQPVEKLILLLMANTGCTQQDIADLKISEVDLVEGRITRRRTKTKKHSSSRLVSYKLWPETLELLKTHINKSGELALTYKNGKPWKWSDIKDGKVTGDDYVYRFYRGYNRALKINKSVMIFRKTSSTLLFSNEKYRHLVQWFLGHSEKTIAERHYTQKTQEQLDEAVDWLRTQYTF